MSAERSAASQRAPFTRAIVRTPSANFADGLTTADLGAPNLTSALEQHARYCQALERCGLRLTRLAADERFPDSTFVEDTAVLTERCAIITRPGAESRAGEIVPIREIVRGFYRELRTITSPGTLDGGDICEADGHFLIGLSQRTNEAGARQLTRFVSDLGFRASLVDIRGVPGILHLKSGLAYLSRNNLIAVDALAEHPALSGYHIVRVDRGEEYAANCVLVNDHVLVASGYSRLEASLERLGYRTLPLDMSEFQKMDGGLSCLSLRF